MMKKFLCRINVQKEESCQLQEFSKNALKVGQKPFLWFVEPRQLKWRWILGSGPSECSGARFALDTVVREAEPCKVPSFVFQLGFLKPTLPLFSSCFCS